MRPEGTFQEICAVQTPEGTRDTGRNLLPWSSGGSSRSRCEDFGPSEDFVLGFQMTIFLLCLPTWPSLVCACLCKRMPDWVRILGCLGVLVCC